MILGLGIPELLIILLVVLLIFGPKNLPKLGKSLGATVKNVREGMEGEEDGAEKDVEGSDKVAEKIEDHSTPIEVVADDDDDADIDDVHPDDPPEGDVVFCSKCGTKNNADAAFCSKCGAKLA